MRTSLAVPAIGLLALCAYGVSSFTTADTGGSRQLVRPSSDPLRPGSGTHRAIEYGVQAPRAPAQSDADEIQSPRAPSPEAGALQGASDDEDSQAPNHGDELQAPRGPETGPAA